MAKLKAPLFSLGATGRLAKHLSFLRRRKQNIVEQRPIPTDAKSPTQLVWRHMYQKAIALWHALSDEEKQEWETSARPRHMTGFAWFMSQCLRPNPGIYLPLQGGTMSGNIDMAKHRILRLPVPIDDQEPARKVDIIAAATFLGLTDTPASYEGNAHKHLKANDAENALVFVLNSLNNLSDVNVPTPTDQHFLYWNETESEWRARALILNDLPTTAKTLSLTLIIDGGGSAITTGQKGHLEVPFACAISRVTMLADQTGSIVVDIWKDTYANFPPTDADSITASAPPTISSAVKSQDSTLTGWTKAIAAGNILAFNVDSCATITRVTISLKVTRS